MQMFLLLVLFFYLDTSTLEFDLSGYIQYYFINTTDEEICI